MTGERSHWKRLAVLTVLALSLAGASARADDDDISFKKRGDAEKQFVTRVATAVVKAAHSTGKKHDLLDYKFTNPKANRTELVIKMEYHGILTNKKYVADIVVKIDSTDKDSWEVLNIDYTDNNNVPANANKIQELIKKLNK
jgi:hypothetical protein